MELNLDKLIIYEQ